MKIAFSQHRDEVVKWLICLLLIVPVILLYLAHLLRHETLIPTGFLHSDFAQYMAYAREYFDSGGFHLLYGNPFDDSYTAPRVNFQIQTLLLGIIWRLTGWDPGTVFLVFAFVAALVCARVAMMLYEHIVGLHSWAHWLGLMIFFWGGGLLAIAGALSVLAGGGSLSEAVWHSDRLNPGGGWWCLNFGLNLVFPFEAYYHAVVFLCVLFIMRTQYRAAGAMAFLIAISHPYTSVELLAILCAWTVFEIVFMENREVPKAFLLFCAALTALVTGYYLFLAHTALYTSQLKIRWVYTAENFVPAYILVGGLAVWKIRHLRLAREYFSSAQNRLLAIWFLVAFVASNHEFALKEPFQPLHFTRGYVWIPLFFMGSSVLVALLRGLSERLKLAYALVSVALITGVFVSDNAVWFGLRYYISFHHKSAGVGVFLSHPQKELLDWMNGEENRGYLILSEGVNPFTANNDVGYYATIYTPLRAWVSHNLTTPQKSLRDKELEALFERGEFIPAWQGRPLLIVFDRRMTEAEPAWLAEQGAAKVYENSDYRVFRLKPSG